MRWLWNLRFGQPKALLIGDEHRSWFVHRSAENKRGWNADFESAMRTWCEKNLKRPYWIHGFWDDSTFLYDFELSNEYTVFFYCEKDAALFKLFWM